MGPLKENSQTAEYDTSRQGRIWGIFYLWSMALVLATERDAMALTASASSESPRLASSRESSRRGE